MNIKKWGTIAGETVFLYTLINKNGMKVSLTNIGAGIQSVFVKDRLNVFEDVVLGYDTAEGYKKDPFYIGTVVGRYANRIAGGKVMLDGKEYQLTVKDGGFHHHGGKVGFNKKIWQGKPFANNEGLGVTFGLISPDGEEGFPGNLQVRVTYTLNDQDQLIADFWAETDKTTLINLTQHVYFNLAGQNSGTAMDHVMLLPSTQYLPVNNSVVPTGELVPVNRTPFDFTEAKTIGHDIDMDDEQLHLGTGYDHSWVLKPERSEELTLAAKIFEQQSGRLLTVYTTEPALHVYTGNWLDGSVTGKENARYQKRDAFCLETQNYPDAPNKAHFPSAQLHPGETYRSRTIFEFGLI